MKKMDWIGKKNNIVRQINKSNVEKKNLMTTDRNDFHRKNLLPMNILENILHSRHMPLEKKKRILFSISYSHHLTLFFPVHSSISFFEFLRFLAEGGVSLLYLSIRQFPYNYRFSQDFEPVNPTVLYIH